MKSKKKANANLGNRLIQDGDDERGGVKERPGRARGSKKGLKLNAEEEMRPVSKCTTTTASNDDCDYDGTEEDDDWRVR
jgi:hypothetical protein